MCFSNKLTYVIHTPVWLFGMNVLFGLEQHSTNAIRAGSVWVIQLQCHATKCMFMCFSCYCMMSSLTHYNNVLLNTIITRSTGWGKSTQDQGLLLWKQPGRGEKKYYWTKGGVATPKPPLYPPMSLFNISGCNFSPAMNACDDDFAREHTHTHTHTHTHKHTHINTHTRLHLPTCHAIQQPERKASSVSMIVINQVLSDSTILTSI